MIVDIEAEQKDALVALHFLLHGFAQRVDVGQQALAGFTRRHWCTAPWVGEWALFGEGHGVGDLAFDLRVDRCAAVGGEPRAEAFHLVALDPRLEIRARAIALGIVLAGADVLAPAIGAAFDEHRAAAAAHRVERIGGQRAQLEHVAIVDLVRRDAVGRDPLAEALRRPAPRDRRVDGVIIVLAHEQNRQLVQRGEVEALGEDAFFGRAVAEERHRDAIAARALERQGKADRDRNRRADHRGGAQHVVAHVDEMHRAAFAAGDAGRLAVELGEQTAQRRTLGEEGGVAAIGRRHHVVRAQHVAHADRDGFLSDRQVDRALDLVGRIDARDFFLGAADQTQRAVKSFVVGCSEVIACHRALAYPSG